MSKRCLTLVTLSGCLGAVVAAPPQTNRVLLEVGKPVQRQLAGGQSHSYIFRLQAGRFAHVVADQRGIDIVLVIFSPDNKRLASIDRWSDLQGEESISVVAERTGTYRVEVRSESKDALPGSYELKLLDVREPTTVDLKRIAAERSYAAGDELNHQGSAETRRRALEKLQESLSLWQSVGDPLWEATTLFYLGVIHYDFGEAQEAMSYCQQALPLWRTARNRSGEGAALSVLGRAWDSLGDYQKALDSYNAALPILRAVGEHGWEAFTVHYIGITYLSLGQPERALRYYEEALRLEGKRNDVGGRAHMLHHIGEVYILEGAPEKAIKYLDEALRISRSLKDRLGEATALDHLGRAYQLLKNGKESLDNYNQALMLRRSAGYLPGVEQTLLNIGMLDESQKMQESALDAYEKALSITRSIADQRGEATILSKVAALHAKLGALETARGEAESAVLIAESIRAKVAILELRASYFATVHECYETYIDVLMQLQKMHPSENYQRDALAISERAKARVLLDMLRESHAEIRRGIAANLLDREESIHRQIDGRTDYQMRLLSGPHSGEEARAVQREIDDLLNRFQEVETAIRENSPSYSALMQPGPLSLFAIQHELLDENTLLLEYALGEERSYVWAVSRDRVSSFEIPQRSEIESRVRHYYELVTARNASRRGETAEIRNNRLRQAEGEYPSVAAAIGQMLLGPVSPLLGDKRLLIVGDGVLNYLPFGALPDAREPKPLVLNHEIINLPSASVLQVLRELPSRPSPPKLVAVLADPVFDRTDSRIATSIRAAEGDLQNTTGNRSAAVPSIVTDGFTRLARLPFTREEARGIVSRAGPDQSMEALDFDAGLPKISSGELRQYRIVHFATHGLINSAHPELSGLVFSLFDRRGHPRNGFLSLQDVYNLELPADLVVLSACQTALGQEIKGEGLMGLTRGFMYAGTRRVVASLWSVNDAATAQLMGHFYESMLSDAMSPASALRAAQITMWNQKRWASPYYWAAFTIQGDWK
jgi:CHAT domain-containing protein